MQVLTDAEVEERFSQAALARAKKERADLRARLVWLDAFIADPSHADFYQMELLREQHRIMEEYDTILTKRIAMWR